MKNVLIIKDDSALHDNTAELLELSNFKVITALHKTDSFLGFTSLHENLTYQETTTALEDSTLIAISKSQLNDIFESNYELTAAFIEVLSENVSSIKEQLLQMAYSSVKKKTAQTILLFSNILQKKTNEDIRISKHDLASVAGIATESLIRTLYHHLKKKG